MQSPDPGISGMILKMLTVKQNSLKQMGQWGRSKPPPPGTGMYWETGHLFSEFGSAHDFTHVFQTTWQLCGVSEFSHY